MDIKLPTPEPRIIPRSEHGISRANISPAALKVLYRLRGAGFQACLVGGGVRDLLLGREPKDFDVATDALPEDVRSLFRNCRLIGRRFRLAHVRFGGEIIEVATFRAGRTDDEDDGLDKSGRIISDNVYGTIEEDAWRRDFTINALYYDIDTFGLLDFADGLTDLQKGLVRLIGEPQQRLREDPVRMLRAVRFAAKLGFRIHQDTEEPLTRLGHLLEDMPPARLYDEVLKLFLGGSALQTFELLRHYRLFGPLFPLTEAVLAQEEGHFPHTLLVRALANTDTRIEQDKPVTPSFLFAALLWQPLRQRALALEQQQVEEYEALQQAADQVIAHQVRHTALPKRFSLPMREIWTLQSRFAQRGGKRPLRLLGHPRFRAAYDFMLLRAEAGEEDPELARWWTEFTAMEAGEQEQVLVPVDQDKGRRRPRRRPRRPSPRTG
ncbi:MAG: polynucleotide adenylyltransferase PcnB [Candidatus Competibacteraceae bacterium]|nr:polynucleotide adenylyltransferase PcnB [Candidatus Competibacteraceae bacterium]